MSATSTPTFHGGCQREPSQNTRAPAYERIQRCLLTPPVGSLGFWPPTRFRLGYQLVLAQAIQLPWRLHSSQSFSVASSGQPLLCPLKVCLPLIEWSPSAPQLPRPLR